MECPGCHYTQNSNSAKFCENCGNPLGSEPIFGEDEDTTDYSFRSGREFEGYEIIEQIGTGGHGVVYKVKEIETDKIWALKVLTSIKRKNIPRFKQEFRVLSKLQHKNIVGVQQYGQYGEMHYYVMEYVDGINMRDYIKQNIPVNDILEGDEDVRRRF